MRCVALACIFFLSIRAAGFGEFEDEPLTLDSRPAASEPSEVPPVPATTLQVEPLRLGAAAAPAATAPASRPAALRIGGVPARQWLNRAGPIQGHNLEGRLWVLGVLEPWSEGSRKAARELAKVAGEWSSRGVEAYLVTVAPADEVQALLRPEGMALPIGTGSRLPVLLALGVLPEVYLVGPDYTVVWSGPVGDLADELPSQYERLTPGGLALARENELTNRLNRAKAALEAAGESDAPAQQYFRAAGLAATVADATPGSHPLHRQGAELLGKVDAQGERLLEAARSLVKEGTSAEAHERLTVIAEGFYGRAAGAEALQLLAQIEKDPSLQAGVVVARNEASARQTLQMAEQAMAEQRYADAERYYQLIGQVYPRTPAAGKARQGLAQLHKNKGAATQLAEQKVEPQGPVLLMLAARYAQMGRTEEARQYYQQVLQIAPGTAYARQAKEGLARLVSAAGPPPGKVGRGGK